MGPDGTSASITGPGDAGRAPGLPPNLLPDCASGEHEGLSDESASSVAQFADCGDWRAGTRAERFATIEVLRGQLTPQRSPTAASPLSDERAYEVFQKACSPDYAESLRLYKLYVRVQGFAPLST